MLAPEPGDGQVQQVAPPLGRDPLEETGDGVRHSATARGRWLRHQPGGEVDEQQGRQRAQQALGGGREVNRRVSAEMISLGEISNA